MEFFNKVELRSIKKRAKSLVHGKLNKEGVDWAKLLENPDEEIPLMDVRMRIAVGIMLARKGLSDVPWTVYRTMKRPSLHSQQGIFLNNVIPKEITREDVEFFKQRNISLGVRDSYVFARAADFGNDDDEKK